MLKISQILDSAYLKTVEMSISDKISLHKERLYFLMRNDPYFHVGYAH